MKEEEEEEEEEDRSAFCVLIRWRCKDWLGYMGMLKARFLKGGSVWEVGEEPS